MRRIPPPPRRALALEPLRAASLDFSFFAGAWMGLALAPLMFGAIVLGTAVAVADTLSRAVTE